MLELLVGFGLATSAGLNAYVPLLVLGLADRFFSAVELPSAWAWLSSDVALWIIGLLLVIEVVADKVPAVDSVNDIVQTVVRPASGGIVFGAGAASETVRIDDPATFFTTNAWVPVAIGIVIALVVHAAKAAVRPIANAATAGVAAPVVSTVEDIASAVTAVLAIIAPVLAALLILVGAAGVVWLVRRWRRRRAAAKAEVATPRA